MTNAEYEKISEIQAGLDDIQIRHHFVTNQKAFYQLIVRFAFFCHWPLVDKIEDNENKENEGRHGKERL